MIHFLLSACVTEPPDANIVETGALQVCFEGDGASSGDDADVEVTGQVSNTNGTTGDCSRNLDVHVGEGTVYRVGWTLLDDDGTDITPDFDVAEGDAVTLLYRYRLVWGDAAGFVLRDADDNVVAAADEGAWGSALEEGDVPGLSVSPGEVVATEATDCEPLEGHTLLFEGDDTVEIEPVDSGTVAVGGAEFTAYALRATSWGEGTGCDVSDTTEVYAWALSR